MAEIDIAAITREAEKGNGCVIADQLSLLGLTDRINVLDQVQSQNFHNRLSRDTIPPEVSVEHKIRSHTRVNHIGVGVEDQSSSLWKSAKSIYHEDYDIQGNASTIECVDLHLDQPNANSQKRTFKHRY
ncbi:MAG TPA: hypothetical protein V6D17_14355 [Candidatus Obscuribacterales bacterium]